MTLSILTLCATLARAETPDAEAGPEPPSVPDAPSAQGDSTGEEVASQPDAAPQAEDPAVDSTEAMPAQGQVDERLPTERQPPEDGDRRLEEGRPPERQASPVREATVRTPPEATRDDEESRILGLSPRNQVMLVATLSGGYAGAAMLAVADAAPLAFYGMTVGSVGTAAPVLIWTRNHEVGPATGVRSGSYVVLGSWTGAELARWAVPYEYEDVDQRMVAASAFGDLSGLGLSLLIPEADYSVSDWVLIDGSALAGWMAGASAATLIGYNGPPNRRPRAAIELAGGYGMAVSASAAAHYDVLEPSFARGLLWTSQGAWIGGHVPYMLSSEPDSQDVAAGAELGAALGWLGSTMVPWGPDSARSLASTSAWTATGTALGWGVPIAVRGEDGRQAANVAMVAGGLAGHAAGLALGPSCSNNGGDVFLMLGGATWTGWQALGWAYTAGYRTSDGLQPGGAAVAGLGLGSAYALGAPLLYDPTLPEASMAASGAFWGTTAGFLGGWATRMEGYPHGMTTMILGNAALLATTAATAGPWDPDMADVAIINGAGLLGMGWGALGAYAIVPGNAELAGGALIGTAGGLAVGTTLSLHRKNRAETATRPVVGPGLARYRLPVRVSLSPGPWIDEDGNQGVFVQARILEREP